MRPRTPPSWKQPAVFDALHGSPVVKSRMNGNGLPARSTLCEKSPARSRAVGTRLARSPTGSFRRCHSWLQKKNSFRLSSLNMPGMNTGPPIVYPESLRLASGSGTSGVDRLFSQVLAFQSERRPYQ